MTRHAAHYWLTKATAVLEYVEEVEPPPDHESAMEVYAQVQAYAAMALAERSHPRSEP